MDISKGKKKLKNNYEIYKLLFKIKTTKRI